MKHHARIGLNSNVLYTIMVIGFIYTLHYTLPVYIASSFLETFVGADRVGLIYTAAAMVTIVGFLGMSSLLTRFGNKATTIWLVVLQAFLTYGLMTSDSPVMLVTYFIIQTAVIAMIGFNLDIFIEAYSDVQHVGGIRGLYLTVANIAWIISPLIGGMVVDGNHYQRVYMAGFGLLFVLWYLVQKNFTRFHDPKYPHITIAKTVRHLLGNKDLTRVCIANIILQAFYAWMTIYTPIYLHTTIGMSWQDIGIVFTIMLLPFVIFQIPAGRLADKSWGEKELMTIGFLIIGLSTICMYFIHTPSILVWAGILFISRIGASVAEIMIETYFFKKVSPSESNVLSLFRITRPVATVIAPVITAVGLIYTSYDGLFIVLGCVTLVALFFTMRIKDTN
jgi:MFS family permease